MNTACDIAIVGGGMVGLTLAALLREQGLKLLLLDADAPPRDDLPLQPDRYHRFRHFAWRGPFNRLLYMHYPNGGVHGLKLFGA